MEVVQKNRIKRISLSMLFIFFMTCQAFGQKKVEASFFIEYSSSTKTIRIEGNQLEVTEWIEQYDNPVSSMPSGRKEVVKSAVLSSDEIERLKGFIKQSGFMSIPKEEYGAKKEERFYPFSILVRMKGREKIVIYQSNPSPDVEAAPKAFTTLEKKLNELESQQKNWK